MTCFSLPVSRCSGLNKNQHVGLFSHSNLLFLALFVLFPDVLSLDQEEPGVDQTLLLLLMKVTEPAVIVWKREKEESERKPKTHSMFFSNTESRMLRAVNKK